MSDRLLDCVFTACLLMFTAAGLDSPVVYCSLSGGGLDAQQLADTGEELLLLLQVDFVCSSTFH